MEQFKQPEVLANSTACTPSPEQPYRGLKVKKFYTYSWLRGDGTPYYVGKGCGRRAYERLSHSLNPPSDRSNIIVECHESETDAFDAEIFLISFYGRLDLGTGCLRNMTDGGDNPPRNNSTPPNHKGKKRSVVTRARMSRAQMGVAKGRVCSRESVEKRRAANTGRKRSPAFCRQMHELNATPERRAAQSLVSLRYTHTRWHSNRGIKKVGCALCE